MLNRLPIVTLLLAAAAVAIHALGLDATLQLSRGDAAAGTWWTLLTGHLTHWSTHHLAWDVLALLVLGAMVERAGRIRMIACVLASAIVISVGCFALSAGLTAYRGLSGIDSALFAMFAVEQIVGRDTHHKPVIPRWSAAVALVALAGKTAYEFATGQMLFVDADPSFTPLPLAHVLGACAAVLVALLSCVGAIVQRAAYRGDGIPRRDG